MKIMPIPVKMLPCVIDNKQHLIYHDRQNSPPAIIGLRFAGYARWSQTVKIYRQRQKNHCKKITPEL
jgi:hypothetical protein